ncbi:MAG: poly-beta-1,6-N-acetyl-D-glucosamine synthase [Oxalicibacterium faecigallinarum]|uniref:Poly-beta-1,6-N-acetyl-D-glucosamine synthase n=1 Tax=Oxalicibacterium faecigallinarum TaxID=573741 RepID=A0A8J3AWJ7_9BURK|nr:poly-beta-1,6-N-acetyl-D-glucosamine synthase [Oxalicibacterium faecigallinarum]MDQ7970318.1 poly-beta-1,6-N-acetyl-D-glucosamine synthase [Oxalicibacterium faecigallinarum]GGI18152.1 poly-beta-1,6 N-acetyl-D-glucosamine synthase [Oxalicibacterium faecigallinarum]
MLSTNFLFAFTFYYPLFMAYVWIIGGITYYLRYERKGLQKNNALAELTSTPPVSIVVPCFNEEHTVRDVVESLALMNYPDFEIICVNDGSTDKTGEILDDLMTYYPMLRVVHQDRNQGKAVALNTAALVARSEFLLCIDGDAILDKDAIPWLLRHFETGPRLGAVTGNPRIRTRSTLLGRLQVGEFSSIIGLIKRTQRIYGRLFTVSGVIAMFRRRALLDIGFWSPEMLTEDIDISWKMQLHHYDVRFEPRALCWILMPETVRGLWRQRLRWAMGGIQAIFKYSYIFKEWRLRRMWLVYIEYVTSVIWAFAMGITLALGILNLFIYIPPMWRVEIIPSWYGVAIGTTCLLQVFVGMVLDRHYDKKAFRHYFWMIWYPVLYWMLNMCTTIWALPKTIVRNRQQRAIWVSPDRGIGAETAANAVAHDKYASKRQPN